MTTFRPNLLPLTQTHAFWLRPIKMFTFSPVSHQLLMDFERLKQTILDLLGNLRSDLTYHSLDHTRDVMDAADKLAAAENIKGDDWVILMTAALFHDTGFLRTYRDHESASVVIAKETLPGFAYSARQVDVICDLIIATRIPQSPQSKLAEVLCDADLDYLGRSDYEPIADNLYKEFRQYSVVSTEKQWIDLQIGFLSDHRYFTPTAHQLRESGKQAQLARLKALK